jgi:hypothetical protein
MSVLAGRRYIRSANRVRIGPVQRMVVLPMGLCYTAPMIGSSLAKGDHVMNLASVYRVSPWILVALLTVLILLTLAVVALSQSGMLHVIGAALQGSPSSAWVCGASNGGCP